jgi:hypothetical protein
MIDEKFEVQAFLATEAAVVEAAAVETMLESVEVSGLGAGLAARVVRVEPIMGAP